MAKQELLATIRDRYRASSKREKSRILDEFIAETGHHRKHGIRLLGQSGDDGEQQPAVKKGRRIYDESVRQALIVVWEAADRICGKRLKAGLPHLVESPGGVPWWSPWSATATWIWTLGCANGCCQPAPPPRTGCSSRSGHRRRAAGSDAGGISRRAVATVPCILNWVVSRHAVGGALVPAPAPWPRLERGLRVQHGLPPRLERGLGAHLRG